MAIVGVSMGGYGALKCALSKPEQYGYCYAFSSACLFLKGFLDGQGRQGDVQALKATYGDQLVTDIQAAFGEHLELSSHNDLLELARSMSSTSVKPKIYCTCGTEDDFRGDNLKFRDELTQLNFDVVCEEWSGAHDWTFFNESYRRALKRCCGG